MTTDPRFKIARRVVIAKDALSPQQKKIVEPILASKRNFVEHANQKGMTGYLPGFKNTFVTKAGKDMRVIYTRSPDGIVIQDIMRKATIDQLLGRRKPKAAKKPPAAPAKKGLAAKLQEA